MFNVVKKNANYVHIEYKYMDITTSLAPNNIIIINSFVIWALHSSRQL